MIPTTTRRSPVYTGTGVLTAYAFAFKVFAKGDVAVAVTDAAGIESMWALDTQFTVTLNSDQDNFPGGNVTPLVALPVGYSLVVIGNQAYNQTTQFPTGGSFNATVHERALDRLSVQIQQLAEAGSRALVTPASDGGTITLPTRSARAGKFPVFDALGNLTVGTGTGADAGLRTDLASGTFGALLVAFKAAGVGAVLRTLWSIVMDRPFNVKHFGAKGDGATNDTAAVQAALSVVPTGTLDSKVVYFPEGMYLTNAGLTAAGRNITLAGEGPRSSMLVVAAGVTAIALDATGCPAACVGMRNMGILESGAQPAMTALSVRNAGDFFLQNVYFTTSGRALDIGSSAGDVVFSMLNQVRIECFGGQEAIRYRCGGGNWSNVYARKARSGGVVGPTLWISGQSTSLEVSNCAFSGKGTPVSLSIRQINAGAGFFDVIATGAGLKFTAGETIVIRGTSSGYDATWKINTLTDADTARVLIGASLGNLTPLAAFVDKLHATVYLDNTAGPVNESLWSNVLFEGIDDGGSAGGTGSVSLYADATGGTGAIGSHQFNTCTFDAGQTGVYLNGKHAGGGDYLISDFRFMGSIVRYVKNAFNFKEVRGITIDGFAGDCIRSHGTAAELLNSAAIYLDSFGFQPIDGITISNSNVGRQASYHLGSITGFSPDYGLRFGGAIQDIKLTGSHFFGITGSVLVDSTGVVDVTSRITDTGCTYASSAGGETNATRIPTIASATTITLPFGGDAFTVSGTTTIATISGGWSGRKVEFITTSALTFGATGNILPALTTVAGQLVVARYDGVSAKWHIG